jgi:hypothetical protein
MGNGAKGIVTGKGSAKDDRRKGLSKHFSSTPPPSGLQSIQSLPKVGQEPELMGVEKFQTEISAPILLPLCPVFCLPTCFCNHEFQPGVKPV